MSGAESPKFEKPIYVTQPFLPPLEEFIPYLEEIWENKILTNGGPLHQRLERALCDYLEVPYISLFNNGTIALITALQALELRGEVITTPYTFVATTNAILWNNLKPVFVDIDPETLNLDPTLIEAAITPKTSAILPVHCYGTPCDVDAINAIAKKNQLKVVYDAAHAFGVRCHCGSLLNHGDLSVLSFHATKVFNTFEGGAIVCQSKDIKARIDQLKNFGFASESALIGIGLNGKMSELSAAAGLAQLTHLENAVKARREIDQLYRQLLKDAPGLKCLSQTNAICPNHSYFPIFVTKEHIYSRDELLRELSANGIFARRYFHPLVTELTCVKNQTPVNAINFEHAARATSRVLCLPIYPTITESEVHRICKITKGGT